MWTLGARAVHVVAHFGGLLVLARHLDEVEFGLAAMVAVVTGFAGAAADLGMGVLAVQRKEVDDRRASDFALCGGVGTLLLVMLAAPWVARAFGDPPGLVPLLRLGSAALLFAGWQATARARLARDFSFGRLAAADAATAVVASVGRIAFALHGFGAWSIVLGDLCAAGLGAAALWLLAPATRRTGDARLLADGVRVIGARAADACFAQADRFLVGSRLGASVLGLYGFAAQHALLLPSQLAPVAEQVALPVLSRLQDDAPALRRTYLGLTRLYALAVVPFAALLWAIAPWLIDLLYPERWREAVPILRALSVAAAASGLNSRPGLVWLALGRMRLRMIWSLANLVALVAVLLVGVRHGAVGVAYALAARSLLATVAAQVVTKRVAGVPHGGYVRALLPAALIALAIAAVAP